MLECVDDTTGDPTDADGNTDCNPYEELPNICGKFDNDEWTASVICCVCGGGMEGDDVPEEDGDLNAATDLSSGTFSLGDQDLYVIYPTTEKSLDRPRWEFPIARYNTKSRSNDCTKVVGFQAQDTI